MTKLYVALAHHPVRSRDGESITTAVTNLDVHDLARLSRSYGVSRAFVVTPIEAQKALVGRIVSHWEERGPKRRIPERSEAMRLLQPIHSIDAACRVISAEAGTAPEVWVTAARTTARTSAAFAEAQQMLFADRVAAVLLVFGTGHGLSDSVLESADLLLAPVRPNSDFNHLSVRTAMAICLDRLLGDRLLDP